MHLIYIYRDWCPTKRNYFFYKFEIKEIYLNIDIEGDVQFFYPSYLSAEFQGTRIHRIQHT